MKSVRFSQFGVPEEVLTVEEVPMPEPASDEVLIRMQSRPINPSDVYQIMGLYGVKPKLPATPGMEGAGVIERIGSDVTTVSVGQKVIPVKAGGGTWQEYLVCKAEFLIPVPDAMTVEAASMLIANPLSAFLMTREVMTVSEGEWIAQTAAGSALGQMVVQLSKIYGFKTINIVRRREAVDEMLALGGDTAVCSSDEDVTERILEITGGKGVKYAIDAVAGKVGSKVAAALAPGGTMLIYGALDSEPVMLNPGAMIFKELRIEGFWLTKWLGRATDEQKRRLFGEMMPLVISGRIVSPVAARYPLDQAVEAVKHSQREARGGKIVIVG